MSKSRTVFFLVGAMGLAACQSGLTANDRATYGGLTGAAAGYLAAGALDANPQWTILSTLGGAVAGTMVARNTQTQQCAYANGDGTYRTGNCP